MTEAVSTVMRREILTLEPAMPIRQAAGLLHARGQGAAPVLDAAGALVGVLTQKDCFRPALLASYYRQWSGTVGERMSSPVRTIDAGVDLVAAAEMFLAEPHRSFPVVEDGRLVGMLHREDVLGRFLQLG